MIAYEIHTYHDGKWKIDSVFDDRDLALFEARRVDEGTRYTGVRVVEEVYDEVSDLTKTRTIFRGGNADRQEKVRKAAVAQKQKTRAAGQEPIRKNRRKKTKEPTNIIVPVLILAVLLFAGLSALLGLQQLAQIR